MRNGKFYDTAAPSMALLPVTDAQIPGGQPQIGYDGAGRPTVESFRSFAAERWHTTTSCGGDRVNVVPLAGAPPTTTLRQVPRRHRFRAHDETRYTYTDTPTLAGWRA